jgi:hypothetical protein
MKYAIAVATLGATLALAGSASAQYYRPPSDRANSSIWAMGDNQIHSTPAVRAANSFRNGFGQDGTSQIGGGAMTGPSTTTAQGFGAAAGGSTGGAKSGGP